MRWVIGGLALFLSTAAHADESAAVMNAARVLAVDVLCPAYSVNYLKLNEALGTVSIKPGDLGAGGRYHDEYLKDVQQARAELKGGSEAECNQAWAIFGDDGTIPGFLAKRR